MTFLRNKAKLGTPGWIRTYNQLILNQPALPISVQGHINLVVPTGIEPVTFTVSRCCATSAPRNCIWGEVGNRTLVYCFTDSRVTTTLTTP